MTYLALGDSYTIGELVEENSFPKQVKQILLAKHIEIEKLKIIAKTGWTTDELEAEILKQNNTEIFDWVSLLIGVNNQYRGRNVQNFEIEFTLLLQTAIKFANNKPHQVVVLSIPDWGLTPFNTEKDVVQMSAEIDAYNFVKEKIAKKYNCNFINITESTRQHATIEKYLATDGLHYSADEYCIWANKVVEIISKEV